MWRAFNKWVLVLFQIHVVVFYLIRVLVVSLGERSVKLFIHFKINVTNKFIADKKFVLVEKYFLWEFFMILIKKLKFVFEPLIQHKSTCNYKKKIIKPATKCI